MRIYLKHWGIFLHMAMKSSWFIFFFPVAPFPVPLFIVTSFDSTRQSNRGILLGSALAGGLNWLLEVYICFLSCDVFSLLLHKYEQWEQNSKFSHDYYYFAFTEPFSSWSINLRQWRSLWSSQFCIFYKWTDYGSKIDKTQAEDIM